MASLSNATPEQLQAILNGPALPPPPGVQPNFIDPHNFWLVGVIVVSLGFSIATLSLMMRLYTRCFIMRQVGIEDLRVVGVLYGFCIMLIKIAILLQYVHIFVPRGKAKTNRIWWACYSLIWVHVVYYLVFVLCQIFACTPIAKAWDPLITTGHCISTSALEAATGGLNCISDIIILILPQLRIWKLQMSRKKKIQLSLIFLSGIL
ncbi:hypothetical protein EV356DRAFT_523099 [Viridothelium virens]|uniref:Rhodopsin domain-containing protein n=1 Tax=Viridothelium virens TaxID=1048519 RepID=A0A6A6HBW4_VIRVR|nr:hypothetical protein EV356DRAFT_523099 [Viridothelium virens]